jgi:hypothetical protein
MALKSCQADGYSGSTRLHCDLCDAVNLMVFSSPPTGTALWHIFKASDSLSIWTYIREFYGCTLNDPIHSQHYYLGPADLNRLAELHGVAPYAIHQKVGEAVYIPAGCAHQVCGMKFDFSHGFTDCHFVGQQRIGNARGNPWVNILIP